jgi:hypothetical protein
MHSTYVAKPCIVASLYPTLPLPLGVRAAAERGMGTCAVLQSGSMHQRLAGPPCSECDMYVSGDTVAIQGFVEWEVEQLSAVHCRPAAPTMLMSEGCLRSSLTCSRQSHGISN